jgi:hypothetical protein
MDIRYKKKLIDDIAALINISDNLAQSFDFKVKELRDMYQDEIRQHNEFKGLIEGKKLDIKFEMEYIKADWTVSVPGVPDFDTGNIPMEIITHITNNASSTGIIKMIKDFETEDGRKFNIYFEKTSEHVISGTIKENIENFDPYTDFQDTSKPEQKTKMDKSKELFIYMQDNEGFWNWVISQFYKNWKPLIDNGCFNESSRR